jgi:peptide/nickel transport system substrate-binding protein
MTARRRTLSALLAAAALLGSLACRRTPAPAVKEPTGEGPQPGGQVVVAALADITTLNEYQSSGDAGEAEVIDLLFPALMVEQPDYQLHPPSFAPRLATSWEFSADNRDLTFHLRPDARWSDGTPVTAEDVRFTFLAQNDPRVDSVGMEIKDFIKDVEVMDPHTVRFHFSRVYPYQLMDANDGHIVPAHAWGKVPFDKWRTTDFEKILVTGGPFRFAAHIPQQTIVLQRDPTYWNAPRPYLDRLVFRILPDMAGQLAQLFAGDVDLVPSVAPQEADRVVADPDLRLVEYPSRLWGLVGWNNRRSMFADRRVRRALSLGINRKALVDTVFRGHAKLATGPVLSSMWAFDRSLPQLPYDQAQAAALLAQAGWRDTNGDGILDRSDKVFAFDLLYPAANTLRRQMALLIQADLARLGIKVRPVQVEFTSLISRAEAGDFDAVLWVWEEATKIDLTSTWSTPSPGQGSNNFIGYSNPEVDRLIAVAREEPDYTRAKVLLDRIQEAIVADQPVTFLYEANRLVATSRRLEGADINAAGVFFNIDDWYWSR